MLDVLIVGCGNIAGSYDDKGTGAVMTHAGAYTADGRYRLAACVEPDDARREAFMATWSVDMGYQTLDDALGDRDFDVVSVCTPTAKHRDTLARLTACKHGAVFCEKPVAVDFDEASHFVQHFAEAGRPFAVNHLRRWDPAMAELRRQIGDGVWGDVRSIAGFYTKGILNNGSHMIDLLQFLIGPLTAVSVVRSHIDHDATDPTLDAVLRLDSGQCVQLVSGDARDYALFELRIVAENGVIDIEDSGFVIRQRQSAASARFDGYRVPGPDQRRPTGLDRAMLHAVANLHDAATSGASLMSDGTSALRAQSVCRDLMRMAA